VGATSDSRQVGGRREVCGGVARLPQSSSNLPALLSIEIEIERADQSVIAVYVNPDLGGLKRLIEEAIVGQNASAIAGAGVQAIMEHYHSPFRNAARAALLHAWEACAQADKRSFTPSGEPAFRPHSRFLD
jgi:hypothetical protein